MKKYVYPSRIGGTVNAPASKSVMQRYIAASLLADGESIITSPSFCDDSIAAMRVARGLGAEIAEGDEKIVIKGGLKRFETSLNCGESGLCIRMFTPIAALTGEKVVLTGEGSLAKRPVSGIEDALSKLGVTIKSNGGHVPIELSSKIRGGKCEIDGSLSSQFLTGLLMALPLADGESIVNVSNLKSREYVDITIDVLNTFGVEVINRNYKEFEIMGGQRYRPSEVVVEGDWSGAAFLLCAGAVSGNVKVGGLNLNSHQPDRAVIEALKLSGAAVNIGDIIEVGPGNLKGFEFDATECPDLFPPLAALALYCEGETLLRGAGRLKHKESDRGSALISEFGRIGGSVRIEGDTMIIKGGPVKGGTVDSHGDHRMAMAAAVAALGCTGNVEIENAECINKSYNDFYNDMVKLGAEIK